jgi:preprotein translocase subunit SecB
MDCKSFKNVDIALTQHRIVRCSAETKIKPSPLMGGFVEFTFGIETPKEATVLKKGDTFSISISVKTIGMTKDNKSVAFQMACKMEGSFNLLNCEDDGISTDDCHDLWMISASQLYPLVAQFATELIARTGFKNINVPPFVPSEFKSQETTPPQTPKKRKK